MRLHLLDFGFALHVVFWHNELGEYFGFVIDGFDWDSNLGEWHGARLQDKI